MMKRIIELSENDYKVLKEDGVQNHIALADTIIACSVPYEERPQGKWKDYSDEGYVECPFCGCCTNCEDNIAELHYCWNCGAKMETGGVGDAL